MPIITINLMQGRDLNKKRILVEKITQAVCESIDVQPKNVRIILSEMSPENYAISGQIVADQDDPFGHKK